MVSFVFSVTITFIGVVITIIIIISLSEELIRNVPCWRRSLEKLFVEGFVGGATPRRRPWLEGFVGGSSSRRRLVLEAAVGGGATALPSAARAPSPATRGKKETSALRP